MAGHPLGTTQAGDSPPEMGEPLRAEADRRQGTTCPVVPGLCGSSRPTARSVNGLPNVRPSFHLHLWVFTLGCPDAQAFLPGSNLFSMSNLVPMPNLQ